MKIELWDRVRFHANQDDYRPIIWPPIGPYWCSGEGEDYSIIVAYFPHKTTDVEIRTYWPEATVIDRMQTKTDLTFYERFSEPTWWKELK